MKTNEFIEKVEELGFTVSNPKFGEISIDYYDTEIATVAKYVENDIYLYPDFQGMLSDKARKLLLNLLYEYTSTPISKRKEEYYIKHKHLSDENGYLNYFNYEEEIEEDRWFFGDKDPIQAEMEGYRTSFSLEELPQWVISMIEDGYMIKEEVE